MWKLLIGAAVGYVVGRSTSGTNSENMKPLAKAAIKAGIQVFEKGYEVASHFREAMEDVVAETRSDLATEAAAAQREQEQETEQPTRKQRPRSRTTARGIKPKTGSRHASSSKD